MLEVVQSIKPKLDKAVEHYQKDLQQLRIGRASGALVENLLIESYGMRMPLKQLALINIPDAKTIMIQPWDKNSLKEIEKAISESDLGLNPVNNGTSIILSIPALTEERRKDLVKVLGSKTEDCRVKIRANREEVWKEIQEMEENGDISEDEKFKAKEDLQKLIDECNEKIKTIAERKEEEIMKV